MDKAAPQEVQRPTQEQPAIVGEHSPSRGLLNQRCVKCGLWKHHDTSSKLSDFPYYRSAGHWSSWCKSCYTEAARLGAKARIARRGGDQAGALMPGEGELQRSVRRGDRLMSVAAWVEYGSGALVLLNGEAVYQLEIRDDGVYVRILRRFPLNPLPPIPLESFVFLRGKEEGVYYL